MANLKRHPDGKWSIKAREYYTQKTGSSKDMIPIIKQVINNDFNNVKIVHEDQYKSMLESVCCEIF